MVNIEEGQFTTQVNLVDGKTSRLESAITLGVGITGTIAGIWAIATGYGVFTESQIALDVADKIFPAVIAAGSSLLGFIIGKEIKA